MPPSAPEQVPRIKSAFGAVNRSRLIQLFLAETTDLPWQAVYKLILWIDKTTGLAHCYESDKCQPGKNWHVRSLRFHDWLSTACDATPATVGESIDWPFRHVADDYAHFMVEEYRRRLARALLQRAPFDGRGFPQAGDDPSIVALIREVLGAHRVRGALRKDNEASAAFTNPIRTGPPLGCGAPGGRT